MHFFPVVRHARRSKLLLSGFSRDTLFLPLLPLQNYRFSIFSASFTSPFLRLLICQFVYPFTRLYALFPFSILCTCVFYKRFFDREASFNATFFVQRTPKFHRIGRNLAIYRDWILCTMSYEYICSLIKRTLFWGGSRDGALIEPNTRIHALASWLLIITIRTQMLVNQVHLKNKVVSKLLRLH